MSNQLELNSYIANLHQRLRLHAWLRGAAIFTGTALAVTIVLVLILNQFAFPDRGMVVARLSIFVALGIAAALGLALPLMKLTHAHAVHAAETATPELEQRLTTFQERNKNAGDPFLELLAADTLRKLENSTRAHLVTEKQLFAFSGAGFACLAVLVWLIAAGPGYLGYGSSLLWTGPKNNIAPLYSIAVTPGNVTVRRNSDQLVQAHISGMQPVGAKLYAHFQSAAGWEPVLMRAAPQSVGGTNFQFVLAALPEDVEYYIEAGPLRSQHYKVRVVDLPQVKEIGVTYNYPRWTGLKTVTEEHSGDLRALEGTDAEIEIQMDHPLKNGELTLDDGQKVALTGGVGNKYEAIIHMQKDGAYHVAATEDDQPVRISEDYFIATDKANPPEISIIRPGGDYRASPIEEVTLGAKAADDFGLADVHLHYSVNGGADHDVSLLKTPGAKSADGTTTLPLEDFKLVPGDLVSVYATARDGHSEARTDISFIQVDPFEREFSQSQQSGGGGGGGGSNNQTEISKREKELIAATWKQQNDKTATPKDNETQGQFLSDAQKKLRDQVMALSVRMQSRDLSSANQEFTDFDKDMQIAAQAMAPSANKLKATQWKDALPLEQKALQALLRAEATFRKIEVAFSQRGGGGGGGGGSTGRDLASLFDLELDTEKNQYETAQTSSPAEQREKEIEDALAKLDALAKRQDDLANQQHNPQQSFQDRWQQEMLRREAEQLQRQMEQMAQNGQSPQNSQQGSQQGQQSNSQQSDSNQQNNSQSQGKSQSQSNSRASGSGSAEQSSGASANSSNSTDQRIQQALNRLGEAANEMRRNGNAQQNSEAAQQAARRLREASNLMQGTQQHLANNKVESLAREASRIQQEEGAQASRIDKLASGTRDESNTTNSGTPDLDSMMSKAHQRDKLAGERQQLSNDLSTLQQNMRDAARSLAPNQPNVAKRLRDALTEMDDADLDNHVQRTADWLRSGINPNSMGTEGQIAQGLSKLNQQLQQAQKEFGQGANPGNQSQDSGDQAAALNQVQRMRRAIEDMGRQQNRVNSHDGQNGQDQNGKGQNPGNRNGNSSRQSANGNQQGTQASQSDSNSRAALRQNGSQQGGGEQAGGPGGQQANNSTQYGSNGTGGDLGNLRRNGASGDIRPGGRGADGTVWDNINTGNNSYGSPGHVQPAPTDASGNPADTEREFAQRMRELNELRSMVGGDPQIAKDVAELTRQMQNLDPKRFPGNPAMVEQMHREVLGAVDKLELQLQRQSLSSSPRGGKPDPVPAGYQDSVADYYRRLSTDHK
jgi:hypothetical protein